MRRGMPAERSKSIATASSVKISFFSTLSFSVTISIHVSVNEIIADSCLFINGRIIAGKDLAEIIPLNDNVDKVYLKDNVLIAARLSGSNLKKFKQHLNKPL